ncbi:MAG: electron transfer flavoprotein subunit beta/FixA family protein [Desulfosarcina sp.]
MNIVCCLKQVPDTAQVKIDPETNTLIREGVESILNPFDLVALEQAVRIRDAHGGRIWAICMGPPQAEAILRQALAQGADRAVLLSDRAFAGADTLATSYTLTRAIQKIDARDPVDLVLCGKQAIDGDTAQTGPGIATRLKFSQLTYVIGVAALDPAVRTIEVIRRLEDGLQRVRGRLPAVLTVELELARPHRASLTAMVAALKTEVAVWDAEAIDAVAGMTGIKGSPTWVRKIAAPTPRTGGPRFEAAADPEKAVESLLETLLADDAFASELLDGRKG